MWEPTLNFKQTTIHRFFCLELPNDFYVKLYFILFELINYFSE